MDSAFKPRPRSEIVMRLIRPVALQGVAWLARYKVNPQHVVLTHGVLGLAAAALVAVGGTSAATVAAGLLIAKVVLDNIDGGLARATGQVTLTGRYLDTVVDFLVNIALFAALTAHGPTAAVLLAIPVLTLVLSIDYNLERLYREARGQRHELEREIDVPMGAPRRVYALLRGTYQSLFAPQDRLVEAIDRWTYRQIARSMAGPENAETRRAWNDLFSMAALVNLGLSTQLIVLAATLVAGHPFAYVWFVLLQAPYVLCVWILRAWRFREYLRRR
jgi:phosphatidylglycerophosphate synthase